MSRSFRPLPSPALGNPFAKLRHGVLIGNSGLLVPDARQGPAAGFVKQIATRSKFLRSLHPARLAQVVGIELLISDSMSIRTHTFQPAIFYDLMVRVPTAYN